MMFGVRQGTVTASIYPTEHDESVLAAIAANTEITLFAPCGGKGRCGKCTVTIPNEPPPPTRADRRFLDGMQIAAGVRLACTCPADAVRSEVQIPVRDRRAFVKGDIPIFDKPPAVWNTARSPGQLAVAIDIGTTTVAVYLLDTQNGAVTAVAAEMNRQTVYGADVLSRITYGEQTPTHLNRLAAVIRAQLSEMISAVAGGAAVGTAVIVGNTTMLHLLAEEDPSGIGRAPFVPRFIGYRVYSAADLGLPVRGAVHLLPAVAAYVGADIVSAAVAADMDRTTRTTLLVDIGTNGELALSHGDTLYACSTAAGPAFEGASISAGVGGIAGAVASWYRDGSRFSFTTIDDAPVVGICGSGILDLMATLLEEGEVDATGRMVAPGSDAGPAVTIAGSYRFTQKDVREVQLAKAAIAAGIDVLCAEAGISVDGIQRLVLTGGFGNHLRVDSAIRIGLLPRIPRERYVSIDNGAGRGAVMVLRNTGTLERMVHLAAKTRYIELSRHPLFEERYIEQMIYPEKVHT